MPLQCDDWNSSASACQVQKHQNTEQYKWLRQGVVGNQTAVQVLTVDKAFAQPVNPDTNHAVLPRNTRVAKVFHGVAVRVHLLNLVIFIVLVNNLRSSF